MSPDCASAVCMSSRSTISTQMETSPLADAEFRERIPYHRGITLIAEARQTPDVDERAALFDKASQELDEFVTANPESPASAEALLELANVLVDQAKQLLRRPAKCRTKPPTPSNAKNSAKKPAVCSRMPSLASGRLSNFTRPRSIE